jgi:hypothetical protein
MPSAFEEVTLGSQMTDYSADFMGGKSRVNRYRHVVKPKLGFEVSGPNMNMRRFTAFIGIKEGAIWAPAQDRRH